MADRSDRPVMVEEFLLNDEGRYVLVSSPVAPAEWRPGLFPELTISLAELEKSLPSEQAAQ